MIWKKEKPYEGRIHRGCNCCPPIQNIACMKTLVAVGFGYAMILKDSEEIYREDYYKGDETPTLKMFEDMAQKDPDHDWRMILFAPLRDQEYQRQGQNEWVLIKSGIGFA